MNILNPLHTSMGYLLPITTLLISLTTGCGGVEPLEQESTPSEASAEWPEVPSNARMGTAYLPLGPSQKVQALSYTEFDGMAVFEGDIILGKSSELRGSPGDTVRSLGVSITGRGFRWPEGLVPYTIKPDLANPKRVHDAIRHWQDRTNVRFVERTSKNAQLYPNYVTFQTSSLCISSVGMVGKQQFIGLGTQCGTGNVIHEIGHAMGLLHEQGREDRDSFVRINYENIKEGSEGSFKKYISNGDDRGAYDYGSIMHYGALNASSNGKPTITVLTPGATIGQRKALSSGDIRTISTLYPASTTVSNKLHAEE